MALDAAVGTVAGVRSLTQAALGAGATREEIMETFRVAQYLCEVGSVYVAAEALEGLFEQDLN